MRVELFFFLPVPAEDFLEGTWRSVGRVSLQDAARYLGEPALAVAWDRDLPELGEPAVWVAARLYQATGVQVRDYHARMLLSLYKTPHEKYERDYRWYYFDGDRWHRRRESSRCINELYRHSEN